MRSADGDGRAYDGGSGTGRRGAARGLGDASGAGLLLVPLLLATLGCHAYRSVDGEPVPGRTVRVALDTARWSGHGGGSTLTGEVASSSGDSLRLVLGDRSARPGAPAAVEEDTLAVPYDAAARLEYRSISVWRSAAVAAGVVGATALTFEVASRGGVISNPGEGGGGPQESIVVRIPLALP